MQLTAGSVAHAVSEEIGASERAVNPDFDLVPQDRRNQIWLDFFAKSVAFLATTTTPPTTISSFSNLNQQQLVLSLPLALTLSVPVSLPLRHVRRSVDEHAHRHPINPAPSSRAVRVPLATELFDLQTWSQWLTEQPRQHGRRTAQYRATQGQVPRARVEGCHCQQQ
jgi:hypothetical protein